MQCSFCAFSTDSQNALVFHHIKKHRSEADFNLECSLCFQVFQNVNSLKSHQRRKHGKVARLEVTGAADESDEDTTPSMAPSASAPLMEMETSAEEPQDDYEDSEDYDLDDCDEDVEENQDVDLDYLHQLERNRKFQTWNRAKFLLYLREEAMISQTAVNKTVCGVQELFKSFSTHLKDRLLQRVDPETNSVSTETLCAIFSEVESEGMFSGIDSKKLLDSFLKSRCDMTKPEAVTLHSHQIFSTDGTLKAVKHNAYYVPFLDSLKKLLIRPDIFHCIDNPTPYDGLLRNFRDGSYCQNHPIFSDPKSLAIILYFDELEVVNPLGSKKHKLAMFYWTLANLPLHLRSSLKSVNLLGVAWARDLKQTKSLNECVSLDQKYDSFKKILSSFVEDVKTLQNGITINVGGSIRNLKGSLLFVTGDTPAVNCLGGFKESVGKAHKPCHVCFGDDQEIRVIFSEDHFQLRNAGDHSSHLASLSEAPTLAERVRRSVWNGVNGPSPLKDIDFLDPILCFVLDLMHILHEGVLEAHMRVLIDYYTNDIELFSLKEINEEISQLSQIYPTDKPSLIESHHLKSGLRQTAAQMINLAFLLPFILMKKTCEGGRLENFVRLLKIANGLLMFQISAEDVTNLKAMIQTHNETFMLHYPKTEITPKFHFLIHLPSQVLRFGPSRVTWTMRLEAFHSYFKTLIRVMKNFKNPPMSLCYRYLSLRCCQLLSNPNEEAGNFFEEDEVFYADKVMNVKDHFHANLLSPVFGNIPITLTSKLEYKGFTFKNGSIVLLRENSKAFPLYGQVTDIVVQDNLKVLICHRLETHDYNPNCNAYNVSLVDPPECRIVFLENIANPFPFRSIETLEYMFVLPRYHKTGFMPSV